jgi:membrane protein implicated in regulation of membrane protease activity
MDSLIAFVAQYGPWSWVVAGLALLALELVAPGGIFLWLGIAAVVTGIGSGLIAIDWPVQFVIFGVLSIASIAIWLKLRPHGTASDRPFLNRRAARFVGQEVVLNEPIRDGFGRVSLDDTTWRVQGPDLAAGQKVRIIDFDGAVLKVEAVL